jgi:hypothetical protein
MYRTLNIPHNHRSVSSRRALRPRANARCDENAASLRHALQLRPALLWSVLQFVIAATFCCSLLLQQRFVAVCYCSKEFPRTALLSPWNRRTLTLGAHLQV